MARYHFHFLIGAVSCAALFSSASQAQEPESDPGRTRLTQEAEDSEPGDGERRHWKGLPKEKREKVKKNYERWKQMSPEERRAMRELHKHRREIMHRELSRVGEELGVDLDDPANRELRDRYLKERRELEERLRRDMEEPRRAGIREIVERLRLETGPEGQEESDE